MSKRLTPSEQANAADLPRRLANPLPKGPGENRPFPGSPRIFHWGVSPQFCGAGAVEVEQFPAQTCSEVVSENAD